MESCFLMFHNFSVCVTFLVVKILVVYKVLWNFSNILMLPNCNFVMCSSHLSCTCDKFVTLKAFFKFCLQLSGHVMHTWRHYVKFCFYYLFML